MIPSKEFTQGKIVKVTIHRTWEEDVIVEAKGYIVHEVAPYHQYQRAQLVTFVEPRKQIGNWEQLVPDNASYLTVQGAGQGYL
jgi:hypothetical protein